VVDDAGSRPVFLRPVEVFATTGASGHRIGGGHRLVQSLSANPSPTHQPDGIYRGRRSVARGVVLRLAQGGADRCDHLAGVVDPARLTASRGSSGTDPWHAPVLGLRASFGQRTDP